MAKTCKCPSCGAPGVPGKSCAFCGNAIPSPKKGAEKSRDDENSVKEDAGKASDRVFLINNKKTSRQVEKSIKDYLTNTFNNLADTEPASHFINDYETAVNQFTISAKKIFLPLFHFQGNYEGTCLSNGTNAVNLYGDYSVYRCANQNLYEYEAVRVIYPDEEDDRGNISEDEEEYDIEIEYSDSVFVRDALPEIIKFCESGIAKQEAVKSVNALKRYNGTLIEPENIADQVWKETKQQILESAARHALGNSKCSYVSGKFSDETQHLVFCVVWRVEVTAGSERVVFFTLCTWNDDPDYGYRPDFSVDFLNLYKTGVIGTTNWDEYVYSTQAPPPKEKELFITKWYEGVITKLEDLSNKADEKLPGAGCLLSGIFFGLFIGLCILILTNANW